jgi:Flp pilus assembly pilin Flp
MSANQSALPPGRFAFQPKEPMTSIFFLMWLADVAGSISVVCTLILIAVVIILVISALYGLIEGELDAVGIFWRKASPWLVIPLVIGLVTPSKGAVQLIAIGSAVKVAADTELGKKATDALTVVLDKIKKDAGASK